jgi:uncharacterized Zn-binding protein involved in type VI secretion
MSRALGSLRHTVAQHLAPRQPVSPAGASNGAAGWWGRVQTAVPNLVAGKPGAPPQTTERTVVSTAREIHSIVGTAMSALSVPADMLNSGFASLTAPLAAALPAFPAATITALYVGLPHTHNHPPSLIPPAPPVPLPSLGSVMLGTSVKVLINGMPAARCGDIGLAPTCCGFTPFFQIKTGSSNTFIGGNRAARVLDICQACTSADSRNSGMAAAGKLMGAVGSVARGIQAVQRGMGIAGIAMNVAEAATEDDAALSAAKAMAAAMDAAQLAADAAAAALSQAMGKDPAGLPPKVIGAITVGHPNVLIGGFPMVNIPNPADMLLKRLARYKRSSSGKGGPSHCPSGDCPAPSGR